MPIKSVPKARLPAGIKLNKIASPLAGPSRPVPKMPQSPPRVNVDAPAPFSTSATQAISGLPLPENLTHTSQAALPVSELATEPVAEDIAGWGPGFEGMTEEEVFRLATLPKDIEGVDNWGIPDEVDPEECARGLKVGSG
jgi:hypothetical protein